MPDGTSNINREKWFKADWVDNLKLRASYGTVGNRPTSLYPQYDLYSISTSYNGIPSALISQIGNKDLTWEKTYTTGVGLDASMFGERFRFSFDYYYKYTSNILLKPGYRTDHRRRHHPYQRLELGSRTEFRSQHQQD